MNLEDLLKDRLKIRSEENISDLVSRMRTTADYLEQIRQKRGELEMRKQIASNKYDQEMSDVQKELAELRQSCRHPCSTYYPDASGNNDSSTICRLCGKEL